MDRLKACASLIEFRKDKDGKPRRRTTGTPRATICLKTFKLIARELSNLRIVG